jgi:hypothetical protein
MSNLNNVLTLTNLLENTLMVISKDFPNFTPSISTETFYIDCYASDHVGVYVQFKNNNSTGMFISVREVLKNKNLLTRTEKTLEVEYNVFLPKYESGDSSVGLSDSFYNGFEGHKPDLTFNDILDASVKGFLSLVELNLTPHINSFLEYESFKNYSELNEEEV